MSGRPQCGEDLGGPVAAAQVRRRRAVAQPAQVDVPGDSLALRHLGEVPRALPLAFLEPAPGGPAPHRVNQVVGDLDALSGPAQRLRIEHVGLVELEAAVCQPLRPRPVAHETAHRPAAIGERSGQPPAHEPGGAGHECAPRHATVLSAPGPPGHYAGARLRSRRALRRTAPGWAAVWCCRWSGHEMALGGGCSGSAG